MSEQCSDISQNITKLSYPGDNLGYTTEIDGRENKEDFLTISFDHMYACNSDNNSDVNSDRQAGNNSEVRQLKELLLLHLDLIQQQSDEIVNKDKYISELKLANEQLRQRLDCMERLSSVNNLKFNSHLHSGTNSFNLESYLDTMTHDTGFCADTEDSKDNLKVMGLCREEKDFQPVILNIDRRRSSDRESSADITMGPSERCYSNRKHKNLDHDMTSSTALTNNLRTSHLDQDQDEHNNLNRNFKETRQFALRRNSMRKRLCSGSSQLSNNESLASVSDERRKSSVHRKKQKASLKRIGVGGLTTDTPYITQTTVSTTSIADEPFESIEVTNTTNLEVPRWRIKVYTSCYSMEGTENLDDEVFNRRHIRLENDERRRKRWDVQRIREQRNIERLKQRQDRQSSKTDEHANEPLTSFWPSLEDVRFIEVADELPVSAFGTQLPKVTPSEFRLPWLNGTVSPKKTPTRKSTARRKSQKR